MRLVLVEALTFARRLARRRVVRVTLALDAAAVAWLVVAAPVGAVRAAAGAAQALGILTALVLSSGCVADDRAAGRLLLEATHPVPRSAWVLGRWLAVVAGAAGVTVAATGLIVLAGPGTGPLGGFLLGLAAAVIHLGAFAALAVALSVGAGGTEQVLALVALLTAGLVPPDVLAGMLGAPWLEPAARAGWTLLPTPWALDRVQAWAAGAEGAHPVVALALLAQAPLALAAGARAMERAELGARRF